MEKSFNSYKGYIYKITNIQNNKCYIGQTIQENVYSYIEQHFNIAFRNQDLKENKKGRLFYNTIRKYGRKNFKIFILGEIEEINKKKLKQKLDESEIECISFFNSTNEIYGYNLTKGGDGVWGIIPWSKGLTKETDERIKKLADNKMGISFSEQRKKNVSIGHQNMMMINNGIINKQIKKDKLQFYIDQGWQPFRLLSEKCKNRVWINNGQINKKVSKNVLNNYLDSGWIFGKLNNNHMKGRIRILNKNDNTEKRIKQEDLQNYLNVGWELVTDENKKLLAHKYITNTNSKKNS